MLQIAHHVTVDTKRKTYNDENKCKKGPGCCNFVCKNKANNQLFKPFRNFIKIKLHA